MSRIETSSGLWQQICSSIFTIAAIRTCLMVVVAMAMIPGLATEAKAQAQINLNGASTMLVNHDNTQWTVGNAGASLDWTITVTKVGFSDNFIDVDGFIAVSNNGPGPGVIENIVVNLQTRCLGKWASVAADMTDVSHGVRAKFANIVAAASKEDPTLNQQCLSSPNYEVTALAGQSAQEGTFFTSAASGKLLLKTAGNSVFDLRPRLSIKPYETISLFYTATFNNKALGLTPGTPVRTETIITFGRSGVSGGSGFLAYGIDADGDEGAGTGVISGDSDEKWARSIPIRQKTTVPSLVHTNNSVNLVDTDNKIRIISGNGTLSLFQTDIGGGTGTEQIDGDSLSLGGQVPFTTSITLSAAAGGATVENCAQLDGKSLKAQLAITNPFNGLPGTHNFRVDGATHLIACDQSSVSGNTPPFAAGSFCTYTQAEWAEPPNGSNIGTVLDNNFAALFPNGLTSGRQGTSCTQGSYNDRFASQARIWDYLPRFGGTRPLSACELNPTDDVSGVFGGNVLALRLNMKLNNAGLILGSAATSLSGLRICATGSPFDGKTVPHLLNAGNRVLAGGSLPPGMSVAWLEHLVRKVNESFDSCGTPTYWAELHLVNGSCP